MSPVRHLGGPAQGWNPKDLGTALVAWFDASVTTSVTTGTGGVSQWNDLSGNGNHATQSTEGNRPASVSNGIQFTRANSDRLIVANLTNGTRRCCAAVVTRATTDNHTVVGGSTGGIGMELPSTNKVGISKIGTVLFLESAGTVGTSQSVLAINVDATAAQVSINGTATTGSHSQTFSGTELFLGTLKLSGTTFSNHLDGTLHEVVIADPQTTGGRERIEGYLAWKWGLQGSLATGHPYKNVRP